MLIQCVPCGKDTDYIDGPLEGYARCAYCDNTDTTRLLDEKGCTLDSRIRHYQVLKQLEAATTILTAYDIAACLVERGLVRGIDYRGSPKADLWYSLRRREYGVVVDCVKFRDALQLEVEAKIAKFTKRGNAALRDLFSINVG